MLNPANLPRQPGVYLYKNAQGEIIYVGKAKSLRSRVSSYFKGDHAPKTQLLVSQIADLDFIIVDNEVEALLLENKLIKKHAPKYNISLKDGKTYAYIQLTAEPYPRVLSTRKTTGKGAFFGPYTDGYSRQQLVEMAVKLFKLRVCRSLPKRACLNYHIGLCTAPCIGKVSKEQYQAQAAAAGRFLKGDTKEVIARLDQEMRAASAEQRYESAAEKKRQIEAIHMLHERQKVDLLKRYDQDVVALRRLDGTALIELFTISKGVIAGKKEFKFDYEDDILENFLKAYYTTNRIPAEIIVNTRFWGEDADKAVLEEYFAQMRGGKVELTVPERGEKAALVRMVEKNADAGLESATLREMQSRLTLPSLPRTIECFDISNLGTQYVVAGMVQWVDGKPNKPGYRRFEMKTVKGRQDDFAAIHEAVLRRYSRLSKEGQELPNLIVIDGGPGQLNAALTALKGLGLQIPIISLAKQEEEIYTPSSQTPLRFDTSSQMMLLLRAIRDSVHRFALSYNKKKRQMGLRDEFEGL